MSDLVNIEDAKALKRMGLPLYMPVEHRQFARESTKLWCRLWDDLAKFCGRMLDYEKDPTERKPASNGILGGLPGAARRHTFTSLST